MILNIDADTLGMIITDMRNAAEEYRNTHEYDPDDLGCRLDHDADLLADYDEESE